MALNVLKQHRAALAGTLVVAVLLVGVFHAPPLPVFIGCVVALGLQQRRAAGSPGNH
jgi:hypothetical protein